MKKLITLLTIVLLAVGLCATPGYTADRERPIPTKTDEKILDALNAPTQPNKFAPEDRVVVRVKKSTTQTIEVKTAQDIKGDN